MNNGLEELDKLMETFYELCEECNCNEDMYQKHNLTSPHHIIRKKLERLEKLEKVVDILNRDKELTLHKGKEPILGTDEYKLSFVNWKSLTKEEYQLFEEVFGE